MTLIPIIKKTTICIIDCGKTICSCKPCKNLKNYKMILTGKAKEDFEKWYLLNKKHYDSLTVIDSGKINQIYKLDESCQHALIIEWFDSVGLIIEIQIHQLLRGVNMWRGKINNCVYNDLEYYSTRQQATKQSIIKANEIYNNQHENTKRN